MLGDIEFSLPLVDRNFERPRFSDGAIIMGRGEDDPFNAGRQRVKVQREASLVGR
jgi:hypothetical protein